MSQTLEPRTERSQRRETGGLRQQSRFRFGAIVAVAAVVGFVAWLVVGRSDEGSQKDSTAVPISLSGLRTLAGAVPQPIYWVGARPDVQYELTRTDEGRVYIRYLPSDAEIGEGKEHLSIGTYPLANAYAATAKEAAKETSRRVAVGNGGVAFFSTNHPTSVYVAYPDSDYQIEVFDPSAAVAQQFVAAGKVQPVRGGK
jgi:hypothetical protein